MMIDVRAVKIVLERNSLKKIKKTEKKRQKHVFIIMIFIDSNYFSGKKNTQQEMRWQRGSNTCLGSNLILTIIE